MISAPSPPLLGWPRFQAAVCDDGALFSRLLAATEFPVFAKTCLAAATARGIDLAEAEISAAIAVARQCWLQRHLPFVTPPLAPAPPHSAGLPPSPHWLPVHLRDAPASASSAPPGSLEIDWACFGEIRLTDPFFEQSAGAALRRPAALLFRRQNSIDDLEAKLGLTAPELSPAGFVFHLSRCGSTLLAQILATSPRHRVLSEAPPIDRLLAHDAAFNLPRPRRVARLRALVNTYARRRFPEERRLFIKWDAWHILHLDVIQEAFPGTPWIYLHRDPVEILVSQRRQRGSQFLPGMMPPAFFGISPEELPNLDFDTYTARVLGACASAAVQALSASNKHPGLAIDYNDLRGSIPMLLRDHFRLDDLDSTEIAAMDAAASRNSKNPALPFETDSEGKLREANPAVRTLAERWLGDSHRALRVINQRRGHISE